MFVTAVYEVDYDNRCWSRALAWFIVSSAVAIVVDVITYEACTTFRVIHHWAYDSQLPPLDTGDVYGERVFDRLYGAITNSDYRPWNYRRYLRTRPEDGAPS